MNLAQLPAIRLWPVIKRNLLIYALALGLAFGIMSIIIALLGFDVLTALKTLIGTSFKSKFGFQETIKKTIPLIFTTYAFAIPFKIRFFNIGGWGQMVAGGTFSAILGLSLAGANLPAPVLIPLLLIAGLAGGALYSFVAGLLQANYSINPIISTIMLNFVAVLFVNFFATTEPWRDPMEGHPITKHLPSSAILPPIASGVPSSIIFALLTIIFVYILMTKTRLGYEITAVGYNLYSAQAYGINYKKTIILTFVIGGALAGLGGALQILTIHRKLIEGFEFTSGAQYGMFGILTALICAGSPLGVPVSAFFMSVLLVGADALQRTMQIPVELVFVSQALIVIILVVIRQRMEARK